jgi:uncharacterized RmlC-like cupin family protein
MSDESKPEVVAIRTGVGIDSRQKIPYFVGVLEATTGARGLAAHVIIPPAPPPCRIYQRLRDDHTCWLDVETTYGPGLRKRCHGRGRIFLSRWRWRQARTLSDTESLLGIVARNEANEQERVVPYDPSTDQTKPAS